MKSNFTQEFYGIYHDTIFNKHQNDNKRWTDEHLTMLDVCTQSDEGIRNMIKYFERKGASIKDMQRKRAYKRLTFLYSLHAECYLQKQDRLLETTKSEIKMLKKFLNID